MKEHKKKIRMIENARGCCDGINARDYVSGEVYEVSESLAKNFLHLNVAEYHGGEKAKAPHDNKAMTDCENKSEKSKRRQS